MQSYHASSEERSVQTIVFLYLLHVWLQELVCACVSSAKLVVHQYVEQTEMLVGSVTSFSYVLALFDVEGRYASNIEHVELNTHETNTVTLATKCRSGSS